MQMMNEKRLEVLLRNRYPFDFQKVHGDRIEYTIRLCDDEAVGLLREIPSPFYVKEVRYLHNLKELLFYNRWYEPIEEVIIKPKTLVEKNLFWAAKATERWTPHNA